MTKLSTLLALLFTVGFIGCGNTTLTVTDPQLDICEASEVEDLILHVTQGSAKIKVTQVTYENDRSFNTSITYDVSLGDVVMVPFCFKQGDVHFQLEVVPSGPGLLYGIEYSVEIFYEVALPNADLRIWDSAGFESYGYGSAGIGTHTNGETDYYTVAIEWSQL